MPSHLPIWLPLAPFPGCLLHVCVIVFAGQQTNELECGYNTQGIYSDTLLNIYSVPGPVVGTGNQDVKKTDTSLAFQSSRAVRADRKQLNHPHMGNSKCSECTETGQGGSRGPSTCGQSWPKAETHGTPRIRSFLSSPPLARRPSECAPPEPLM